MRKILLVTLLLIIHQVVIGQIIKPEKRIYIVDITASMEGNGIFKGKNILPTVKTNLKEAIQNIKEPNTEISIITFTNKVQKIYNGNSNDTKEILSAIDKIEVIKGNTNIIEAWNKGVGLINPLRTNIIFLLTDGLHNEGQPIDSLYTTLKHWEKISDGHSYYGFYVMLTQEAVQQKLYDVVNQTKHLYPIVSMNIGTSFISTPIAMNVNLSVGNRLSYRYKTNNGFPLPADFSFKIVIKDNPYYGLNEASFNKQKSEIYLQLKEKIDHALIPTDYELEFNYLYDKEKYPLVFFIPEVFKLRTINKGIRKMTLKIR